MQHSVFIFLLCAACIPIAAGDEPGPAEFRKLLDEQLGKTTTINFLVASVESAGPDKELRLIPFDPPGWRHGRPRSITSVGLTPEVRAQFRRIGIADLEGHLRGKTVRVRAKVAANWLMDGEHYQERLVVEDIAQFEAVEQP